MENIEVCVYHSLNLRLTWNILVGKGRGVNYVYYYLELKKHKRTQSFKRNITEDTRWTRFVKCTTDESKKKKNKDICLENMENTQI